jgi:hypothetical protein
MLENSGHYLQAKIVSEQQAAEITGYVLSTI